MKNPKVEILSKNNFQKIINFALNFKKNKIKIQYPYTITSKIVNFTSINNFVTN